MNTNGHMTRRFKQGRGAVGVVAVVAAVLAGPARVTAQVADYLVEVPAASLSASASDAYSDTRYVESVALPLMAIDGSTYSYWETRAAGEQWLQIDLGQRRQVGAVQVYASAHRIRAYALYASGEPAPADWGDPVTTGELPNTTASHTITFDFTFCRYLRLVALSRWSTYVHVDELRVYESGFTLADKQTQSPHFTNSNIVDVVALPQMTGYDRYQITDSAAEPVANWLPYDPTNRPAELNVTLGSPAEGTVVTRYAWFKDEASGVLPTTNAPASISFVRGSANVTAVAQATFTTVSWGAAYPAVIRVNAIDAGSHALVGIFSRTLAVTPNADLTPGAPGRVTLADPGAYTLTLTVTDLAGNIDTTNTALTVAAGETAQTSVWTGAGDGRDWFDAANWSTTHIPGPGAMVTVGSGASVVLGESTADLTSFTITGGTLTFTNWTTCLRATNITVNNNGTLTHAACDTVYDAANTNRIALVCSNLTVAVGGKITASGKGYPGGRGFCFAANEPGFGPGGGAAKKGGGYGGLGGEAVYPYGQTYGVSNAPVDPGSGGGAGGDVRGGGKPGGGVIFVQAQGTITVDGTIAAEGKYGGDYWGSGSGGSIFLICHAFAGGAAGLINADGAYGYNQNPGGGGGRLAVLFVSYNEFEGVLRANGGLKAADPDQSGKDGTVYVHHAGTNPLLTVTAEPDLLSTASPYPYGSWDVPLGMVLTNTLLSPTTPIDGMRHICTGWRVATGGVMIADGTTTQAVFTAVAAEMTLTWTWTNQYELVTAAGPGGTSSDAGGWYNNGETVALAAAAAVEHAFLMWTGDLPLADKQTSQITVAMDRPRMIRAHFTDGVKRSRTWTGGTGNWSDFDKWSPIGIPGPQDDAHIVSGTVTLSDPMSLGSLTLTNGATLLYDNGDDVTELVIGGDLLLDRGAKLTIKAGFTNDTTAAYGAKITVAGHMLLGTNAWIYSTTSPLNGGSPIFYIGRLTIGASSGFNADSRGFSGGETGRLDPVAPGFYNRPGYGPGRGNVGGRGAGHGGVGLGAVAPYGQAYGDPQHPVYPGSGGGAGDTRVSPAGFGGGLVRLHVADRITLYGTITANGQSIGGNPPAGCGSGGGIYLTCRRFLAASGALLSAKGGSGGNNSKTTSLENGAGGRIALWCVRDVSPQQVATDVSGGVTSVAPPGNLGTVYFGTFPADGTLILLR